MIKVKREHDTKWMLFAMVMWVIGAVLAVIAFWPDEAMLALSIWLLRAVFFISGVSIFVSAVAFFGYLLLSE